MTAAERGQAPAAPDPAPPAPHLAQDAPMPPPGERRPMPPEIGGPAGPEPTRYGDWEQKGRCTDF